MEFDFWWLPGAALFFALGWLASRRESTRQPRSDGGDQRLPQAYFRGLNFVLKEDPQQAIDTFTDLVRQEPDLVELHFALGQLFRRRGETDRAIRVHQNLLQRKLLSEADRDRARFEIAQDYFKAGLYDRADAELAQLAGTRHAAQAHALRLDIAQRLKDWRGALALLDEVPSDPGAAAPQGHPEHAGGKAPAQGYAPPGLALRAHLLCELALEHQARRDHEAALGALETALALAPHHPRAHLALGALRQERGQCREALACGATILERWPAFATAIATWWLACHSRLAAASSTPGSAEAAQGDPIEALLRAQHSAPSAELLRQIVQAVESRDGSEAALRLAQAEVLRAPSPRSLLALLARSAPSATAVEQLQAVRAFLERRTQEPDRLTCSRCGFQSTRHLWQCPGCNRWDTYPAIPAHESLR